MTGRFSDGFDWLPSGASSSTISNLLQSRNYYIRGVFPGNFQGASLTTGRWGYGKRIQMDFTDNGPAWQFVVKGIDSHNSAGGYVSCGWNINGTTNAFFPIIGVYDLVNDTVLCCIMAAPNGIIKAYSGLPDHGGTFLGASDPDCFDNNADIDVEVFFKVNNTTGEIEVRINTVSVLHLVNVDTQPGSNAYFDGICWGHETPAGGTSHFSIDDFRYYDTSGSINNTWLGTCRVQTSLTMGAGATTDFSKVGASTNWQAAQNQNVDDTKYVYDPTTNDYDLYTIQPLVNSPVVFWAQVTAFVRQDDATQRQYKNRISSSGTQADGAAYFTSQTYTADSDIFELNPHTSLQFTGAEFNALQIGPLVYA